MRVARVLVAIAAAGLVVTFGAESFTVAAGAPSRRTALPLDRAAGLLERAEQRYRGLGSFRVTFRQAFESATFGPADDARGTIHVAPPQRMIWDYEVPPGQRGVLDGDTWWFVIPEDREVQVRDAAPGSDSPLAELLSGRSELSRYFALRVPEDATARVAGCAVVELWPRAPRDDIERLRLEIDERTADVRRVEALDPLGGLTIVELGAPAGEAPLPEAAFKVEIPEGFVVTR